MAESSSGQGLRESATKGEDDRSNQGLDYDLDQPGKNYEDDESETFKTSFQGGEDDFVFIEAEIRTRGPEGHGQNEAEDDAGELVNMQVFPDDHKQCRGNDDHFKQGHKQTEKNDDNEKAPTLPDKCKPPPLPENNTPPTLPEKSGQKRPCPYSTAETEQPVVPPKSRNKERTREQRTAEATEGHPCKDEELQVQVVISFVEDGGHRENLECLNADVEEYLKVQFITRNYDMFKSSIQEDVRLTKKSMLKIGLGNVTFNTDRKELARNKLKTLVNECKGLFFNSMPVAQLCPKHLMEKLLKVDSVKNQVLFHYTKSNNQLNYVCKASEQKRCYDAMVNVVKTFCSNCKCNEKMAKGNGSVQNQHGDVTEDPGEMCVPPETQQQTDGTVESTQDRVTPPVTQNTVNNNGTVESTTDGVTPPVTQNLVNNEGTDESTTDSVTPPVTQNLVNNEGTVESTTDSVTPPVTQNLVNNEGAVESTTDSVTPPVTQNLVNNEGTDESTTDSVTPPVTQNLVNNEGTDNSTTDSVTPPVTQNQVNNKGTDESTTDSVTPPVTQNLMNNEGTVESTIDSVTPPVTQNLMNNEGTVESTKDSVTPPAPQNLVNNEGTDKSTPNRVTLLMKQTLKQEDEDQAKEKDTEVTVNVEFRSVFQHVFEDPNNEVHFQNTMESFTFQGAMIRCTQELERDMLICHVTGAQHIVDETVNWLENYVKGYFYETVDFADIQYADTMDGGKLGRLVEYFLETLKLEDETDGYWFVNDKAKIVSICSTDKEQAQTLIEKVKQCFVMESVYFENEDLHCVGRDLQGEKFKRYETEIALFEEEKKITAVGLQRHVEPVVVDLKSLKEVFMARRTKVSEADPAKKTISSKVKRPVQITISCSEEKDLLLTKVASKLKIDIKEHKTGGKIVILEGPSDEVGQAADYLSKWVFQKIEVSQEDEVRLNEVIARIEESDVEVKVLSDEPYKEVSWTLGPGHALKLSVCQEKDCWKDLLVKRTVSANGDGPHLGIRNTSEDKKMIQLIVPCIEGKPALEKEKHTLNDGFKHIVHKATAHDCTHLTVSLDPIGGWVPDKFLKAIFPAIQALEDTRCLPLTVQTCVRDSEAFSKCQYVISKALGREPDNSTSLSPPVNEPEELCVEIIQGELSKAKVDVLVNSTSKDLQLDSGTVSRSILREAGTTMQDEIQRKYPRGIQFGEVAQTSGYRLHCQKVFHCAFNAYQYTRSVKPIADIVDRCLEMADKDGLRSIAFPALGTGNLAYPKDKTAAAMLDSIRKFEGSSLKDVKIVIYPADTDTFQKFSDKMKKTAGTTKGGNPKQGKASPKIQTPDIVFGKLKLHARVGSVTGVTADSLIYVWEKERMYGAKFKDHKLIKEIEKEHHLFIQHRDNKELRSKILITKGGNIRVHNIIHIPCEWSNLPSALTQGLKLPEAGKSTVIFFESTHPFLKYGDKLGDVIVKTASKLSPSLQCLQKLEVLVEDKNSAKKVLEYFKSHCQPSNVMPAPSEKKKFTVMVGGQKDEVEKAINMLKNLQESRGAEGGGDPPSTPTEPGDMTMDRSLEKGMDEEHFNQSSTPTPPKNRWSSKPVTNVTFTRDRYVEIKTLREFENEEVLKLALLRPGFPVLPPVIVFAKELKCALLICSSEQDAAKLCKYEGFKDFHKAKTSQSMYSNVLKQVLKQTELIIKTCRYTELKDERRLELIQKLEEAQIKLFTGDNCRLEAPTLCQLSYGEKLLEQFGVTGNETGRQHSECEMVINFSDVQYSIFKDILEKDGSKIVETLESIDLGDNNVSITIGQQLESFKDMILGKEKFVKELSVDEVPCTESGSKSPEQIKQFIQDLEADNSTNCCLYDRVKNRCIVYHESYEVLQKVKHQLNVKMGNVKPTARRKRDFTNVAENVTSASSDSKPKFDWENDAKNVRSYKASDKMSVMVYEASIVKLTVDCIVNAANDILQHGGGVALVIARAAGKELDSECRDYKKKHGPVPVGENCVTTAGKLPCERVIHAVGPRWSDYKPHDLFKVRQCERDLYDAIYNSLHSAEKEGMKSIALPAISSAIFGVPEEICVYQYAKATLDYCHSPKGTVLQEIHFVDIKPGIIREIQKMFDMMVNDHKDPGSNVDKFVKSSPPRGPYQTPRTKNVQYRTSADGKNGGGQMTVTERVIPVQPQTRTYPVIIGNISLQKADVFSVHQKGAAIMIYIDKWGNPHGQISTKLISKIKEVPRYKAELKEMLSKYPQCCITKGYDCGYEIILHVVTDNYEKMTERVKKNRISEAYTNVFRTAYHVHRVSALVLTLIGTGKDDKDLGISTCAFKESFDKVSLEKINANPLIVQLVVDSDKKADEVCKRFNVSPVKAGSHHSSGEELGARSKYSNNFGNDGQRSSPEDIYETFGDVEAQTSDQSHSIEKCVICMDTIDQDQTALKCGHRFCTGCIEQQFKHKKACPTCGLVCGIITGDQPFGTMKFGKNGESVAGFENCGSIWISYSFPNGQQGSNHPNPGRWYKGITRVAYLPDNKEGREVCEMLDVAFKRKLVFTIGYSRTTGQDGVITWNDIHHKTDPKPNTQFGYPDPTYLHRVRDELAVKGVTPADIEDSTT